MRPVVIGVDPRERSATIEIVDSRKRTLGQGRFRTDKDGYRRMIEEGRRRPDWVRAVEGCNGVGKLLAQRLVADGEPVLDVPVKLAARARVFDTGHGRKTDATDARSVTVVALRATGLNRVTMDDHIVALRLLVDRCDELGRVRTETANRLRKLVTELLPGGAKKFLSAAQARVLLATVRPRDVVGRTRRQLAAELVTELAMLDRKMTATDEQLVDLLDATGRLARPLRHRSIQRGQDPRRRRGRRPISRPRAIRQLERHRRDGQQLPGHLVEHGHDHQDMLPAQWHPSLYQRRRPFERYGVGMPVEEISR